jgi:ribosome-associated toxin RatA of RatAB toxin-antitoxin module
MKVLLLSFLLLFAPLSLRGESLSIPSFRSFSLPVTSFVPLLQRKTVVLIYPPQTFTTSTETFYPRFVSVIAYLPYPLKEVTSTVFQFERIPTWFRQVHRAEVKKSSPEEKIVEFEIREKLPVGSFSLLYSVRYQFLSPQEVIFTRYGGEVDYLFGRWEFFPVSITETVVVYTEWSNVKSYGALIRLALKAHPELIISLPASTGVVLLEELGKELKGRKNLLSPPSPRTVVPLLSQDTFALSLLEKILEREDFTVLLIHPEKRVSAGGGVRKMRFVTGVRKVSLPPEEVFLGVTSFSRYPEFLPEIKEVKVREEKNHYEVDYTISLGFSIFHTTLSYTLRYEKVSDTSLVSHLTKGDLEYAYSAWEANPARTGTLLSYTHTSALSDKVPVVMKLGNLIPNRELVTGVSTVAPILEQFSRWVINFFQEEKKE